MCLQLQIHPRREQTCWVSKGIIGYWTVTMCAAVTRRVSQHRCDEWNKRWKPEFCSFLGCSCSSACFYFLLLRVRFFTLLSADMKLSSSNQSLTSSSISNEYSAETVKMLHLRVQDYVGKRVFFQAKIQSSLWLYGKGENEVLILLLEKDQLTLVINTYNHQPVCSCCQCRSHLFSSFSFIVISQGA